MWITAINNQRERGEDTMVEVNAEDAEFYKDVSDRVRIEI